DAGVPQDSCTADVIGADLHRQSHWHALAPAVFHEGGKRPVFDGGLRRVHGVLLCLRRTIRDVAPFASRGRAYAMRCNAYMRSRARLLEGPMNRRILFGLLACLPLAAAAAESSKQQFA